ncbi:MAG: hypothetical protein MUE73_07670 [Planctomycetes bacterium]|jgi:hypothetical protein|nr:hypothetical protein [Planctomycetota bacterium]
MPDVIRGLDDLLRGRKSEPGVLAAGTDHLAATPHLLMATVLGAIFGVAMGLYAATTRDPGTPVQLLASAVKVPALFLLSLLVTLPSLLVFNALLGVRLDARDMVRAIVAALVVNLAVLASFAPILAFFTVCTTSYPAMKLLNVLFFAVAGAIGAGFFRRLVGRIEQVRSPVAPPPVPPAPGEPAPPASETPRLPVAPAPRPTPADGRGRSRGLLGVWEVIYILVACQMAWLLRPLVGAPDEPFAWFGERGGSFLSEFARTLRALFGA